MGHKSFKGGLSKEPAKELKDIEINYLDLYPNDGKRLIIEQESKKLKISTKKI